MRDASLACSVDSDLARTIMRAQTAEEAALAPADRASSRSQLGFELSLA